MRYQINNKTQPWPEEQKRKVIHTWVESIYIRTLSALSILWVPACIFGIMHLCNIKSKMFIRRGFITGQKEQPVPLMFLERSPSPPHHPFSLGWKLDESLHIFSLSAFMTETDWAEGLILWAVVFIEEISQRALSQRRDLPGKSVSWCPFCNFFFYCFNHSLVVMLVYVV